MFADEKGLEEDDPMIVELKDVVKKYSKRVTPRKKREAKREDKLNQ